MTTEQLQDIAHVLVDRSEQEENDAPVAIACIFKSFFPFMEKRGKQFIRYL